MANDENMIQAYKEDKDLYCVIAASVFNNNYEDNLEFYPEGTEIELDGKKIICGHKTHLNKAGKERRAMSKMIMLAITYGMSSATLAQKINKTKEEAQEIMDSFFESFPKVKALIENSKCSLQENGYTEDWAGRRRHLTDYFLNPYEASYTDPEKLIEQTFNPILGCENRPLIDDKLISWVDRAKRSRGNKAFEQLAKDAAKEGIILSANTGRIAQAERQCLNARIQGGSASLTKLAMINICKDKRFADLDAHLVLSIHDELIMECPALYAETVAEILPEVMIATAAPHIITPMKCDPAIESRWAVSEYSVAIQSEFKQYEEEGCTREEAFDRLYANHLEFPREAIYKTITEGIDLEF